MGGEIVTARPVVSPAMMLDLWACVINVHERLKLRARTVASRIEVEMRFPWIIALGDPKTRREKPCLAVRPDTCGGGENVRAIRRSRSVASHLHHAL